MRGAFVKGELAHSWYFQIGFQANVYEIPRRLPQLKWLLAIPVLKHTRNPNICAWCSGGTPSTESLRQNPFDRIPSQDFGQMGSESKQTTDSQSSCD